MDSDRLRQVEELYHAVRDSSPDARMALLEQADPDLRREVQSLLYQDGIAGPIDHPAAGMLEDSTATELLLGTQLGPYRIEGLLGVGGMGQVYRAHDTRLGRSVAIKIGTTRFSERFQHEIRAISALNHPNICTLYDVGPNYMVMELVEGLTLAERNKKGPISLDEALAIARQITEGLAAAHDQGIVHRDLTPTNIKIRPDGAVKILDFGLAKSAYAKPAAGEHSVGVTMEGMVMGTPAYMAPEQTRGEPLDKRADIWAFGCVLYHMLTGKAAFTGPSVADILVAVVTKEPALMLVPGKVRRLLRRCLEKDPKKRLRDIGDVWDLLDEPTDSPPATTGPFWTRRSSLALAAAVLAIISAAATWIAWQAARPAERQLTRFSIDLGPEAITGANGTVAISPDGRRLVFPARGANGSQQLATRLLDRADSTLLPGTEGGFDPFFSPDGQWIGFFGGGQLQKISVQGAAPVSLTSILATQASAQSASWGDDGNIVTAMGLLAPLERVPSGGGPIQALSKLGPDEVAHRWPQVLPGANTVLFTASGSISGMDNANIEAMSLKTGQIKVLQRGGYFGRYLPNGYLLYVHQGTLFGVKFDPDRLEMRGTPAPLLEDVADTAAMGGSEFDFSNTGTFVYAAGKSVAQAWRIGWLDNSGLIKPMFATPGKYTLPRVSPDGRKVSFNGDGQDIYIYDVDRDTVSRITFGGHAHGAVWAPDGKHIVFESIGTRFSLCWARSDGAGEPQKLRESPNNMAPWSFSPDGRRLAYFERIPRSGDLLTLPLDLTDPEHPKAGEPEQFLHTPADELFPTFSPDGHWIAYQSNESGTNEVYVRPFPPRSGGKWQLSSGGGSFAFWSRHSRELFYLGPNNRIMAVDYAVDGDSFVPAKPRVWSETQLFSPGLMNLDLAPDGKRFAVLYAPEPSGSEKASVHVTVLLNFFDEVKRRISATGR
jgi:Tol biopolymer transport system component